MRKTNPGTRIDNEDVRAGITCEPSDLPPVAEFFIVNITGEPLYEAARRTAEIDHRFADCIEMLLGKYDTLNAALSSDEGAYEVYAVIDSRTEATLRFALLECDVDAQIPLLPEERAMIAEYAEIVIDAIMNEDMEDMV